MVTNKEASTLARGVAALVVYGGLFWCVLAAAGLLGTGAQAHAILEGVTPAAGSTLAGPEVDFVLSFNSRLDHQRSRILLIGPSGEATPLPIVLPAASPTELTVRAHDLTTPGRYILRWHVLAVDGHMTRGDIPYTLGGQ